MTAPDVSPATREEAMSGEKDRLLTSADGSEVRQVCPTEKPERHYLGEFPMTCYRCHIEADS